MYMDTDSIFYRHKIDNDPLGEGEFFGDLTDEEPEWEITVSRFLNFILKSFLMLLL